MTGPGEAQIGDPQSGSESPVPVEAKKESTAIRSRWGTKSPGLGVAQMVTRFTGPDEAQLGTRVPESGRGPGKDQFHQVQEAHVGNSHKVRGGNPTHQVQVRPTFRPESPDPGEALVGT